MYLSHPKVTYQDRIVRRTTSRLVCKLTISSVISDSVVYKRIDSEYSLSKVGKKYLLECVVFASYTDSTNRLCTGVAKRLISVRKLICGKVMFLQVSVCPWGSGGGSMCALPMMHRNPPHLHTVLRTPSDGHQNVYGWQAGSMHPTRMLSCLPLRFLAGKCCEQ